MRFLFSLSFLFTFCLNAQDLVYDPPLRGGLLVTGTFGELRSDHFHAGLDFRAVTNTPVYAVAKGFVSRIVISPGGFGQAVYVDHPDGHRSVYAHLETLRPELLDTVRAVQFATEKFSQVLRFDSTAFPLQRGDQVGGVGNRGHSFGPHLHFEMREIAGDAPVNPMDFGFLIPDTRPPQIRRLRVYELDERGLELTTQTFSLKSTREGGYRVGDTVVVNSPRIGLALKTYDRQNGMPNWNGIYGGELYADSTQVFRFTFDRIPFEQTEYLNALTDYADWTQNTSWYHRFWALTQDAMFWLPTAKGGGYDGTLHLRPNLPLPVRMRVLDHAGNVSELDFTMIYRPGNPPQVNRPHQYFLPAGERSIIDNGALRLEFPATALYRDCYFQYASLPDASANLLSETHQLHQAHTPLHGRTRVAIRPHAPIAAELRDKVVLGSCDEEGHWSGRGGSWEEDNRFYSRISSFGNYALYLDTIPPTVAINYFSTDLRRSGGFSVLITDNLSGGGLQYRGTIDGKWVLLEYDIKNDKLTYDFEDGDPGPGEHNFAREVSDRLGNTTHWERRFRR
ncbi:MAG: M23 family metallopeptidase [Bacteroidota bacterium]